MEIDELIESNDYRNIMCIYKIENKLTDKIYIGSTTNLNRRIKEHFKKLNKNIHPNKYLQNSWNASGGKDNFKIDIVEIIDDETFLPYAELYYIEKYRRKNGVYNASNPLEEIPVLKNRNRKKKIKKESKSKKVNNSEIKNDYGKLKRILESDFNDLFKEMGKRLNDKNKYISYEKVLNFIYEYVKDNFERKLFDTLLRKYIKYSLKISVFNFKSECYFDETLKKFNIPKRELTILNRERSHEISEFNKGLYEDLNKPEKVLN